MESPRDLLKRVAPNLTEAEVDAASQAISIGAGQAIAAFARHLRKCATDSERDRLIDLASKAGTGSR